MLYTVDVGWTSSRPVRPDEHTSRVHVEASTDREAEDIAIALVAARKTCEMATSSQVLF